MGGVGDEGSAGSVPAWDGMMECGPASSSSVLTLGVSCCATGGGGDGRRGGAEGCDREDSSFSGHVEEKVYGVCGSGADGVGMVRRRDGASTKTRRGLKKCGEGVRTRGKVLSYASSTRRRQERAMRWTVTMRVASWRLKW